MHSCVWIELFLIVIYNLMVFQCGDDLRQEQLAAQLLTSFKQVEYRITIYHIAYWLYICYYFIIPLASLNCVHVHYIRTG